MTALADLTPRWGEISALLDQALALPPDERARWVETAPIEPAELRDTLRRLLQVQARVETSDFLETIAKLNAPVVTPAAGAEPAAGDAVGPYCLLREIGRGGMGAVWLAERADGALKRQVALKLPRLAWDGAIAGRLARERDILASLEHPHIARLYDAGVDAAGRPWLAMEYVDGQPIDVYCRERGLDTRARVRLLLDVAAAVAHAHRQQVLHRDLKPSNILVTRDGQVRLLDFGIAKLMRDERAAETALTRAAGRALTPDYASPEQVRGEALSVASDVYSLGVVAYELLAGARPYRLKRGSAAELEDAIVAAAAPMASASAADATSARALRGDLDAILNQALRKESARRYPSIHAFADDLRRHLAGDRVQARPDSLAYRTARVWRGHRTTIVLAVAAMAALGAAVGLGATALLSLALAAGLGGTLWQTRRALQQARATQRQAARADAVQQFLVELLGSAGFGAASAEQRRSMTIGQLLERAAQRLRERPSPDPLVQEALLAVVARLFDGLKLRTQAVAHRRELLRRLHDRGAPALEVAEQQAAIGDALVDNDDVAGAIEAYRAALVRLEAAPGDAAATVRAHVQARLGMAHFYIGEVELGVQQIVAAEASPQWRAGSAILRADVLYALCSLRAQQGRIDESEAFLREAIATDADGRDALDPVAVERRTELARLLASRGRLAEAEREFRETLAMFEAAGEPDHPSAVRIGLEFTRPLAIMGRFGEALALIERAAPAVERQPDRYPPLERQRLAVWRADLLLDEGRIEEAAAAAAIGADAMCASAEPVESSGAMLLRARLACETGAFDDALASLDRAIEQRVAMYGPAHRQTLSARNRVVSVLIAAGRFADALAAADDVVRQAPAGERYGWPRDAADSSRAECLLELRRVDEALRGTLDHLERFCALPPAERSTETEFALRLRAARCLLALDRLDAADEQLRLLEQVAQPLPERMPQRIVLHAVRAQAAARRGRGDDAQRHLERTDRLLGAQPSLGPQYRRERERAAALVALHT